MLGPKYYKVVPSKWFRSYYEVRVWRWWWPFWVVSIDGISKEKAAEWIRSNDTYYDGAE